MQSLISFSNYWTVIIFLMQLTMTRKTFYEIESEKYNWSVRELKRQYDSALYTRLALSRECAGVLKLRNKDRL
jgi:predicted nuclease of restriction endonuclease-like (RecB) superfamily